MNIDKSQKALAKQEVSEAGVSIRNLDDLMRMADLIRHTGLAPDGFDTTEKVAVAIQTGLELGVAPMAALRGICVINGRPAIWGDLGTSLVLRSGLLEGRDERWEGEGDELTAICSLKRKGMPSPIVGRFSVADAKQAVQKTRNGSKSLWEKDTYQSYPKRMLMWRARSWAYRDGFSDVLNGMSFAEEVQDTDPREVVDETPPQVIEDLDQLTDAMLGEEPKPEPTASEPDVEHEEEIVVQVDVEPETNSSEDAPDPPDPVAWPGAQWGDFKDEVVGGHGKSHMKEKTWEEMAEGPRGGGRHSYLLAVKTKIDERPNEPMHPWQEKAWITLQRMEARFDAEDVEKARQRRKKAPASMPSGEGMFP